MFTGIVESLAKVTVQGNGKLTLERPALFDDIKLGSSIAVSGVCLTVVEMDDRSLTFDVMPETMHKTTIGDLAIGDSVNLERALPAHGRFEGHVVQGHVEGVGIVVSVSASAPTPGPSPESGEGRRGGGRIWRGVEELRYAPGTVVGHARDLRRAPTKAEELLWNALRRNHVIGAYFRRQHPVGIFILDFYCAEAQLGIEVDGPIHARADRQAYDAERTDVLRERGIVLLRFSNDDVFNTLDAVIEKIEAEIMARRLGAIDRRLEIQIPSNLRRMVVPKGSICLDGVSLTIADVGLNSCTVALIPMTLKSTTLGKKRMGDRVNIETDILVRTLLAER